MVNGCLLLERLLECGEEEKTVHALGNFGSVFELEYFELLLLWFCL